MPTLLDEDDGPRSEADRELDGPRAASSNGPLAEEVNNSGRNDRTTAVAAPTPPTTTTAEGSPDIDDDRRTAHNDEIDAIGIVQQLLGCKIECRLRDSRVVTGRLVCVDRLSNIILADCVEERTVHARDYHPQDDDGNSIDDVELDSHHSRVVRRQLAQAMIPGPSLTSVTMDRNAYHERIKKKNAATTISTRPPSASTAVMAPASVHLGPSVESVTVVEASSST